MYWQFPLNFNPLQNTKKTSLCDVFKCSYVQIRILLEFSVDKYSLLTRIKPTNGTISEANLKLSQLVWSKNLLKLPGFEPATLRSIVERALYHYAIKLLHFSSLCQQQMAILLKCQNLCYWARSFSSEQLVVIDITTIKYLVRQRSTCMSLTQLHSWLHISSSSFHQMLVVFRTAAVSKLRTRKYKGWIREVNCGIL